LEDTTRYTLRDATSEELEQQFLLCDVCAAHGYIVKFVVSRNEPGESTKNERRRRVRISRKLETELARDVGGKVQPGSGNKDEKADVRVRGKWRIEHKYTDSASGYRVNVRDLNAVIRHANMAGELPALIMNFRTLDKRKFAVVPYEVFTQLMELSYELDPNK